MALSLQCCWVVEWLVVSFNAVWLVIHKHLYSQGQMTVVHLFWTDVLSGATAQVSLLSFMRRQLHLFFLRSYSPWVLDREPLFSPWWAAIVTSVRPYYAKPDRLGHKARSPLPCGSFSPPLQVFRDCDDDGDDGVDHCYGSARGWQSSPLWFTL